jgi:hypothetical protein
MLMICDIWDRMLMIRTAHAFTASGSLLDSALFIEGRRYPAVATMAGVGMLVRCRRRL